MKDHRCSAYPFYPNHKYGCKHVSACPHLGGASLGTLVLARRATQRLSVVSTDNWTLSKSKIANCFQKNQQLEKKVEQLKRLGTTTEYWTATLQKPFNTSRRTGIAFAFRRTRLREAATPFGRQ